MNEEELRQAEVDKYESCYNDKTYHMGRERMVRAKVALLGLPCRGSLLDVGCGCREMLIFAREELRFDRVLGTETVDRLLKAKDVVYATVDELPFDDNEFEVVSMFDVMEHLNEFDLLKACSELERVASKYVVVTASNLDSIEKGVQLHITKKEYDVWDTFFRTAFSGNVTWMHNLTTRINETWVIEL